MNDYLLSQQAVSFRAIDALAREPGKQQLNKAELWMPGTVSKRVQDELSKRGWIIKTNVAKVLKMDQS